MLSFQSKISIPEHVLFHILAGETVLLDLDNGEYYGLDELGTRMWSLLGEHGRLEPLIPILLQEYEVNEDRLREDLLALVEQLAERRLVTVAAAPEADDR